MTANFDAWLEARVMALAEEPVAEDATEPISVDELLFQRVWSEMAEDARAETKRLLDEAFA